MRRYFGILIIVLAPFSCEKELEKHECNKDIITNSLIQGTEPSSFQRIIGSHCDGDNSFASVIQTNDSGYIFCGNTGSNAVDGSDVFVLKTDIIGETDWFKFYSFEVVDKGRKAIKTKDDGFLILASSQPTLGYGSYDGRMDLILLKFTNRGLFEWEKTIHLETSSLYIDYDIFQSSDRGYFIFYHQHITNSDGSTYYKSFYIKTDDKGQILLEDETHVRLIWDVAKTQDEGYIICGANDSDDLSLCRLNSQGDSIWSNTMNGFSHYSILSITDISDGYAICGTHYIEAYIWVAFIIVIDSEGNEIWRDDYLDNYDSQTDHNDSENGVDRSFTNILATNDENLIVTGQNTDGFIYSVPYLMKISSATGDVIWEKTYNIGDYAWLNEIQKTSDNGYISTGITIDQTDSYYSSEGFILKTDEYGD